MRLLGVTGSRFGMTDYQSTAAGKRLKELWDEGFRELHHGDCVGVDEELAELARLVGYRLVSHPPLNARLRAYVPSDVVLDRADYLERDRRIAETVERLLACPSGPFRRRSGTWYTINYARRTGVPVEIIPPVRAA